MFGCFINFTRIIRLPVVLAQDKVDEKTNEITAVPKLLEMLSITGSIVTLDAMGCQKSIAKKIREKNADYLLALKGNQGSLNDDIRLFLEAERAKGSATWSIASVDEIVEKAHGRIEQRTCYVTDKIDWLTQKEEWKDLQSIIMIESIRDINGVITKENRFYISSYQPDAAKLNNAIRAHWGIENNVHWVLDVTFGEDASRVRKDNAPENMSIVRHIVLNLLNQAQEHRFKNISLAGLRKKAVWNENTLFHILQ